MKTRISQLDRHDSDHDAIFDNLAMDILDQIITGDNTQTDVANHLRETGKWTLANAGSMLYIYEACGFRLEHESNGTVRIHCD